MKKRLTLVILIFAVCATGAFAQFAQIEDDFSKFMLLLGREVLPEIQQNDLAGTGIGLASLEGSRFFVSLTGGAVISRGILKFVNPDNTDFTTLDVNGLVDDAVPSSGTGRDLYDKSKDYFPYPTVKLAAGLRLIGLDFIVSGIFLPSGAVSTDDLEASLTHFGLRVRKDLIREKGWYPTISLGGGYVYSNVHFKYTLSDFTQKYSGQDLNIKGDFALDTTVHSLGLDLGFSKTFLFLTPFVRTSLWYQNASFDADGNFTAQLGTTGTAQGLKPSASVSLNDWATIVSSGLDINLFLLRLCATGTYNLSTESYGAEISLRVQF